MESLFLKFLKDQVFGRVLTPIFAFFFSRILFGFLATYVSYLALNYFEKKIFILDIYLKFFLLAYIFVASFLFNFSLKMFKYETPKIGNEMFSIIFFSFIFSIPFQFSKYIINYKYIGIVSLLAGFLIYLVFKFKNIIKSKPSFSNYKTLSEIDSLGNGDTYQKGRLFEEYIASIYKQMGYHAMTTTEMRNKGILPEKIQKRGGSGEQGVDVFVYDHVNKQNVIIQCKHYSSKVSNSAIQEIVAAMPIYKAHKAIVITNQYFTDPAKELAHANNVSLIDRDSLVNLINKAKSAA